MTTAPLTKIAIAANVPESFRVLLRAQLDHLRDHGFKVHCIAGPGPYLAELARDGFPTHEVPLTRLLRPAQDVRAVAALVGLFRRERFALVHVHTPKTALLAQLAARLARVPHIVNTIHGLLGHDGAPQPRRTALAAIDRATCVLATALLSQSSEDVERAVAHRMARPDKIRHLGQGIDLERFDGHRVENDRVALRSRLGLPPDALVVAMIARFTREKGYPDFLAMARRLAAERRDIHFLVVGTSLRERDAVQVDPAAAGLDGRLTILVDRRDMPEIYASADLCVLPTYREGFPRSLVEASAMGVPVVSTRIRGCREAVADGETGVLVPPGDGAALYDAVAALCSDPARRARLGAAGARRARVEFDEGRVCARVLALYEELLGSAKQTAPRPTSWAKRLVDVAGALVLLVATLPFLALGALAVALTMGRPILFRQTRIGRGDRAFALFKLRTMRMARPPRPSDGAAGISAQDAQRLTAVGRWLRATSLDELPQLWNVLRGDMSLVGPRPLLPCYLERYSAEQRRRHEVLPGITGLAQIKGRNGLSWDEKFAFDVWYVDHRSLRLDLWILWRTLVAVARRDGIGASDHATMPEFIGNASLVGNASLEGSR
jgi:lipopolysaccharide/colanic/teichoic acid biosynthesis glycosyltransferase/glycosyltransferase involved in cell wall biosynthesis